MVRPRPLRFFLFFFALRARNVSTHFRAAPERRMNAYNLASLFCVRAIDVVFIFMPHLHVTAASLGMRHFARPVFGYAALLFAGA